MIGGLITGLFENDWRRPVRLLCAFFMRNVRFASVRRVWVIRVYKVNWIVE